MFDTHCHLNFDVFSNDLNTVIDEARDIGVKKFLIAGSNIENSKSAIRIASNFQGAYAAVGIHPTEDLESLDMQKTVAQIQEMADNENVVAVGETGLDYYKFKAPASIQRQFFKAQIALAARMDLAIVVHNRQSTKDIINEIESAWSPHLEKRIVYHCCPPDKQLLEHALKRSIFIGVDGDVTYDPAKKEFVKKVPIELIVLETDSPYLTPQPVRQKQKFPNQPKNLDVIARKVAEIKDIEPEKVHQVTTNNAGELFEV